MATAAPAAARRRERGRHASAGRQVRRLVAVRLISLAFSARAATRHPVHTWRSQLAAAHAQPTHRGLHAAARLVAQARRLRAHNCQRAFANAHADQHPHAARRLEPALTARRHGAARMPRDAATRSSTSTSPPSGSPTSARTPRGTRPIRGAASSARRRPTPSRRPRTRRRCARCCPRRSSRRCRRWPSNTAGRRSTRGASCSSTRRATGYARARRVRARGARRHGARRGPGRARAARGVARGEHAEPRVG